MLFYLEHFAKSFLRYCYYACNEVGMSPECNELKLQQECNEMGMQQECNDLGVQQTCNKLGSNKCATNWECNKHVTSWESNKRATNCRAHLYDCTLTLLCTKCQQHGMAAIAQLQEHRVGDRKVASPRFDFRAGNALLFWDRHFTLISH